MTEPIFEQRFLELIEERPSQKSVRAAAVIFLQALFEEAGILEEEDAAA
ncbi:hypothetical protein JST97_35890 [bacterium]|nr:hypothetical protein [bacterium]